MLLVITVLFAALAVACGGSSRERSPGTDAGVDPRDGGDQDTGDLTGERCGSTVCTGLEVCCVDCDGAPVGCADACPGIACPADCRSDADCMSGFELCLPPGESPGCGVPCSSMRFCETDPDCGDGQICVEVIGPCCRAGDPLSTQCIPPCAPGGCPEGQRCNAELVCEATPCAEGYSCPTHTTCTGAGDDHGCARNPCTSDAQCPGGACVSGSCYDSPGSCTPPAA
jgi:hypothetical protein